MIQAQYTCSNVTSDSVEDTYIVYRGSEECLGTLRCVRKFEPSMETFATDGDITVALHIITPKRMKSRYWKYFGFWADENGAIFDNRKVVCRLCNQIQTYHGNTTNLRNHLKIHHKMELAGLEGVSNSTITWEGTSPPSSSPSQNAVQSATAVVPYKTRPSESTPKYSVSFPPQTPDCDGRSVMNIVEVSGSGDQEIKNIQPKNKSANIAYIFCDDLLPIRLIEGQGFQNFIQAIKPGWRLPSPEEVKEDIRKMYTSSYEQLSETLNKTDTVSLAIEGWSANGNSFFTLTAHYITPDWEAEHSILQTCMYKSWQTSSSLANEILQCLETLQLHQKVIAVTTDGSEFFTNIVEDCMSFPSIHCLATLVNQSVLQALWSSETFQTIIAKLKAMAEYFAISSIDAELLEKKQSLMNLPHDSLLSYSDGGWKSIYDMLARAIEQHAAIASVVLERKLEHLEFSTSEWTIVQQLVEVLKAASATTVALLSHEYPCGSTVLPLLRLLLDSFNRENDSELSLVKGLRQQLLTAFSDKFENSSSVKELLNIASFCDPRFKALPHLSDEDKVVVKQQVKQKMLNIAEKENEISENDDECVGSRAKRPREDLSVMEDLFATFFEPTQRNQQDKNLSLKTLEEKCDVEIKNYLAEDRLSLASDPMEYWKCAEHRFPLLGQVAKKMLCISGTCVPSVRIFNNEKDEVAQKRVHLEPDILDCILFLHDYMQRNG